MQVAISELKAGLSRVLAFAQKGGIVEVTAYRKPIARIVGISPQIDDELRGLAAAESWRGVEMLAAFARRVCEHPVDLQSINVVRERLRRDWHGFAIIEVTQPLVELAGDYADTFALRSYDSVQLESARTLQNASNRAFCFARFDDRLQRAARVLGMQTLDSR